MELFSAINIFIFIVGGLRCKNQWRYMKVVEIFNMAAVVNPYILSCCALGQWKKI